jgi:hypothetical protein
MLFWTKYSSWFQSTLAEFHSTLHMGNLQTVSEASVVLVQDQKWICLTLQKEVKPLTLCAVQPWTSNSDSCFFQFLDSACPPTLHLSTQEQREAFLFCRIVYKNGSLNLVGFRLRSQYSTSSSEFHSQRGFRCRGARGERGTVWKTWSAFVKFDVFLHVYDQRKQGSISRFHQPNNVATSACASSNHTHFTKQTDHCKAVGNTFNWMNMDNQNRHVLGTKGHKDGSLILWRWTRFAARLLDVCGNHG